MHPMEKLVLAIAELLEPLHPALTPLIDDAFPDVRTTSAVPKGPDSQETADGYTDAGRAADLDADSAAADKGGEQLGSADQLTDTATETAQAQG